MRVQSNGAGGYFLTSSYLLAPDSPGRFWVLAFFLVAILGWYAGKVTRRFLAVFLREFAATLEKEGKRKQ